MEEELPDEFWISIRGVSSFKNIEEYNKYLIKQIELWQKK